MKQKKASDIKLVSLYSAINMTHGPINIRSTLYYWNIFIIFTIKQHNLCAYYLHMLPVVFRFPSVLTFNLLIGMLVGCTVVMEICETIEAVQT